MKRIPVSVQFRHVHVSMEDEKKLFGAWGVTHARQAEHEAQHVYEDTVTVVGKNGRLEGVHVLGPPRGQTQVELSPTDTFALGIEAPVRVSGDLRGSAQCELVGSKGKVRVRAGVIIPARHLHCTPGEAKALGLEHHKTVSLKVPGRSGLTIEHVTVRVHPTFSLVFHLTTDEAAAYWLQTGDSVTLVI